MTTSIGGTTGVTFPDNSTQNTAATGFGFKNRIINGDMRIDQRNAGAAVTTTGSYPVDRFFVSQNSSSSWSAQQSSTAPAGFTKSLAFTQTTGQAVSAGNITEIAQRIEGYNFADLGWGTANAQSVTLSFWVRCSLTGTFGVSFINGAYNRSYVASYTINAANTWEYKTITVVGDTTGTWATDNVRGININWDLGVGTTFSNSAGSWAAGDYEGLTGGVKLAATSGATFYITGVQLEKGSTATSFDYRPYGTELALCQRYYEISNGDGSAGYYSAGGAANAYCEGRIVFITQKRAVPTVSIGYTTLGDGNVNWDSTGSANATIASSVTGTTSVTRFNVYKTSGLAYIPYQIILRWSASAEL